MMRYLYLTVQGLLLGVLIYLTIDAWMAGAVLAAALTLVLALCLLVLVVGDMRAPDA